MLYLATPGVNRNAPGETGDSELEDPKQANVPKEKRVRRKNCTAE